ncbi:MAG TPA: alanine racemase [Hyphomicrobiaceae bacterium]|nr:alanine racemase [Hyphomicrobiaceae bacterium]
MDGIPEDARAVLEIDLDALCANWSMLAGMAGPNVVCSGVVKADGYGLGLEPVARALMQQGCKVFFVASLSEGRRLRGLSDSITVYILDGLLPGAAHHYVSLGLRPVLSSLPEIVEWAAFNRESQSRFPAAIQVDTGMNRLGIPVTDHQALREAAALAKNFEPCLIMSHLACADTPEDPMNARQLAGFKDSLSLLPDAPLSLANSGGIFLGADYHFDLVRPGIALYGGRAFTGGVNPVRPVVRLCARILQVRDTAAGETVGYGASHVLTRPARIATIGCGYADGFLRAIGPSGSALGPMGFIGDYPVPVIGRVSMDLITVDVTNVPDGLAVRGGWVEVMGGRVTVDDLTDRAGTIGYELLTRLSNRIHRIYRRKVASN